MSSPFNEVKFNSGDLNMQTFGMDRKPQPRKCPDCGKRLPNAKYSTNEWHSMQYYYAPPREYRRFELSNRWWIECHCGVLLLWSFPQQWVRRHLLELFDDTYQKSA